MVQKKNPDPKLNFLLKCPLYERWRSTSRALWLSFYSCLYQPTGGQKAAKFNINKDAPEFSFFNNFCISGPILKLFAPVESNLNSYFAKVGGIIYFGRTNHTRCDFNDRKVAKRQWRTLPFSIPFQARSQLYARYANATQRIHRPQKVKK